MAQTKKQKLAMWKFIKKQFPRGKPKRYSGICSCLAYIYDDFGLDNEKCRNLRKFITSKAHLYFFPTERLKFINQQIKKYSKKA